ncbi:MAG: rhodanese family protein [Alteraurantiacibacter sp.]
MTATLITLTPAEVAARLRAGKAILVDIRDPDEFARRHIMGAQSVPLSTFEQAHLALDPEQDVIFTCRTGMRTGANCDRLAARVVGDAFVLEGGVDGWAKAGLPVAADANAPLEIIRQVQIAAGSLVLIGVVLGFLLSPAWFGLAGFVGAGLVFAGASGNCAMASLLQMAPWNKRTG